MAPQSEPALKPRPEPDAESIRAAMDLAWRDHHHARDQTWRALHMEVLLAAGLVAVEVNYANWLATMVAGVLVVLAALFGIQIALHHRDLERRKFAHIMNCEELLGLHHPRVIPVKGQYRTSRYSGHDTSDLNPWQKDRGESGEIGFPQPIKIRDAFNPSEHSTALFVLRMHIAVLLFALLFVILRLATPLR